MAKVNYWDQQAEQAEKDGDKARAKVCRDRANYWNRDIPKVPVTKVQKAREEQLAHDVEVAMLQNPSDEAAWESYHDADAGALSPRVWARRSEIESSGYVRDATPAGPEKMPFIEIKLKGGLTARDISREARSMNMGLEDYLLHKGMVPLVVKPRAPEKPEEKREPHPPVRPGLYPRR
jgi:hypothetical protein